MAKCQNGCDNRLTKTEYFLRKKEKCFIFELVSEGLGVCNLLFFNTKLLFISTKTPKETGS